MHGISGTDYADSYGEKKMPGGLEIVPLMPIIGFKVGRWMSAVLKMLNCSEWAVSARSGILD